MSSTDAFLTEAACGRKRAAGDFVVQLQVSSLSLPSCDLAQVKLLVAPQFSML